LVEQHRGLEKTRQLLLANLVHELGRPLGAILSAVQALQGGADRDEVLGQEILGGIEQEIGRLRRLLDDLTRLHGRALGSLEIERRPVVLADWLMNLLVPWRKAAEAKGLDCQVTLADDLPEVELDPDRMAQAVGNLFSNAIKFTPPGGTISLVTGTNDDVVWISVSDTGPGIAAKEQEQIFAPFYRGRTDRRFPQGMGLGLSIPRDLVLAHGGQLEVTSTLDKGSRFTISLPLKPG
jgi:signal transduction histidine kinase